MSPNPPGVPRDAVFHGGSTVIGPSMHGAVKYTMWGHIDKTGAFVWHTHEIFRGFVAGCGSGSMTYDVDGTVAPYDSPRLRTPLAQHLTGTWKINPGSGTGGLHGVLSGGGHLDGTARANTSNYGTITGQVTC